MAKYEAFVERKFVLTLTGEESRVLKKMLGNLSCTVAEKDLELTEEEYKLTYELYDVFE